MKIRNGTGPRTLHWVDRENILRDSIESHTLATRVADVRKPCVELASDVIAKILEQDFHPDILDLKTLVAW